jgi:hypothetical protein
MPPVGQASAEDLRTLYRALGVSEETLTRAIQFAAAGSVEPTIPASKCKSRPSRKY